MQKYDADNISNDLPRRPTVLSQKTVRNHPVIICKVITIKPIISNKKHNVMYNFNLYIFSLTEIKYIFICPHLYISV